MGLYSFTRAAYWFASGNPAKSWRDLLDISEYWSRPQMEAYRNKKLSALIAHCYKNVPYYRRVMDLHGLKPRDISRAEALSKLPILTKDLIRSHSKDLVATNVSEMTTSWSRTGGTTGEPIRVRKDAECVAWESMCYERGLRWGGLNVDEPRIRLFGGSLGLEKPRLVDRIKGVFRRDLFLPAFELRADTARSYFDEILGSKYRFLIGYASSVYRLARLAHEMNQNIKFDSLFPTAELMLPEWEDMMRKVFNAKVLPYYGCGEVNSLGYHKPESGGYLVPEEHALIEVLESDGSARLTGEGAFIVSDLDNYAMPILRYANGDAGKISRSNGDSPYARIERLDGRYNSLLMTDRGDLISGAIGAHVFRHLQSVHSYQIIQEEPLRVVIKLVPKADFNQQDQHLILRLFAKHLGPRMKITIEKVPNLPIAPSGKSVFVINHCLQEPVGRSANN